jgi:hypothetical protein
MYKIIILKFKMTSFAEEEEDKFENYEDLYSEMRALQRQLCEIQIENKKLKSKNIT